MKTLGMIGGLGPESTVDYYRLIVATYREQRPDGSYPVMIINNIDLQKILAFMGACDYDGLTGKIVRELEKLKKAGAEFGIIGSNTPHIAFDEIRRQSPIPLISIVEATCERAHGMGLRKVGVFGSGFTMKATFYADTFARRGITVVAPDATEQGFIHQKYMDELVHGTFRPETRAELLQIAERMKKEDGIQGLILGGTELPLILREAQDCGIPFLDTARIHVDAAVKEMLS